MSVLVVGSIALDTVRTPSGFRKEVLGGSATYFSLAASFFANVRIVAVVGTDFKTKHLDFLQERGIDCSGIERKKGKSFRWEGEYSSNLNVAITRKTSLNVFQHFDPSLPKKFRKSKTVFLANIDPELQIKVLGQMKESRLIVCDTMNYWIEKKREMVKELIMKVDVLLLNDAEACQLTGESNCVKAGRMIVEEGPRTVIVKRGEFGAMMFHGKSIFALPSLPLDRVVDPTGAGDSFAGGFVGFLSSRKQITDTSLKRAVAYGNVMASFAVQNFSIESFRALTRNEIQDRYRSLSSLTRFAAHP